MSDIHPIAHEVLLVVQRVVDINRFQLVRDAILGAEHEMKLLLSDLPEQPNPDADQDAKVRGWISMMKLEIVLRQQRAGHNFPPGVIEDFVRKLIAIVTKVGEGGSNSDFFPSRLLLSASLHMRNAHKEQTNTPYNLISRLDDAILEHPWVEGDTPTGQWVRSGRATPVPDCIARVRREIHTPPMSPIVHVVKQEVVEEAISSSPPSVQSTYVPSSGSFPSTPTRPSRKRSRAVSETRSRSRTPNVRKPTTGSDVEGKKTRSSSRSASRQRKKAKSLEPTTTEPPQTSQVADTPLTIRIPVAANQRTPSVPPLEPSINDPPCQRCGAVGRPCLRTRAHACAHCQRGKAKCSLTPMNWKESGLNHQPKRASRSVKNQATATKTRQAPPRTIRAPSIPLAIPRPTSSTSSRSISGPPPTSPIVPSRSSPFCSPTLNSLSQETVPDNKSLSPVPPPPPTPAALSSSSSEATGSPPVMPLYSGSKESATDALQARIRQLELDRIETMRRMEDMEVQMMKMRAEVDELKAARTAYNGAFEAHRRQLQALSETAYPQQESALAPMNVDPPEAPAPPVGPLPENEMVTSPVPVVIPPRYGQSQEQDVTQLTIGMQALAQGNITPGDSTGSLSVADWVPETPRNVTEDEENINWLITGEACPVPVPPVMLLINPEESPVIRRAF